MTTTPTEQTLVDLEHTYWRAIKEKDLGTLLRLTDDPCLVAGAQGPATVNRAMYEKMLTGSQWTVLDFALRDVQVLLPRKDVAFIAYRVRELLDVAGERVTLEATDTSAWIRRNGAWVCSLHTEAVIGDPYGRDRAQLRG